MSTSTSTNTCNKEPIYYSDALEDIRNRYKLAIRIDDIIKLQAMQQKKYTINTDSILYNNIEDTKKIDNLIC